MRVKVPFRSREITGVVWNESANAPKGLKAIEEVLDETPFFDDRTLLFYERAAQYYGISLGELLTASFPKDGKFGGATDVKHFVPKLPELSDAQKEVVEKIKLNSGFMVHLLLGETGSGKTEVYLKLFERILMESGQALLLVPEISLTPQLEDRLSDRLGTRVSVFHSQMTDKQRREVYARAARSESDIFLGTRSALFLPFRDLKLIVVDEEHDGSFKQTERGPYHGRDLAILRGQVSRVPVILGSATPSLETYHHALHGEYQMHHLSPFFKKPAPKIDVIDLKKTWEKETKSFITSALQSAIEQTLEKKEQILLFLNRRGSASQRLCLGCGSADECKHCSVTLTIHSDWGKAICHWCGFQKKLTPQCDLCGGKEFFLGGIGTKEIEAQVKSRFPEARVARLDRDETAKKNVLPQVVRAFSDGKIDILVGTQMISKGIDISKLSLVGVLFADQGWGIPDFRGMERSFQLLKQLMGRAGRRGQSSHFVIQTFSPDHPLFEGLRLGEESFAHFAKHELEIRKMAELPPFKRMALITLSGKSESEVAEEAFRIQKRLQKLGQPLQMELVGPAPAPLYRWKGLYRQHLLVKSAPKGHLTTFLTAAMDDVERAFAGSKVKIKFDRDPVQFM